MAAVSPTPAQWLQLRQLTNAIEVRFAPSVHKRNRHGRPPSQDQLRSRAFAAMAARVVSGIDDLDAAAQVTDYYNDDGIDGFAIAHGDTLAPTIYIVQAKWSANGSHNFQVSETTKLARGFEKLIHKKLDKDNLIQPYLPEIYAQMAKAESSIVLVFASSGIAVVSDRTKSEAMHDLSLHVEDDIKVDCRFLSLVDFSREVQATPDRNHGVDVKGPLEWRKPIKDDPLSLQGIISAAVLGKWYDENPKRLFDDNVRLAKESDVNEEIVACLLEEPQYFLHFNLGINALCESWTRASEDVGPVEHHFKKLRIVNGAQTVHSIHKAMAINRASVENAQVLIRFTRLDKAPPGFGARVARATNRSNPMSARDRLAMDPAQQRLRGEFTLDLGKNYVIRAGDTVPAQEDGCSVQEAAIAMACGRYDVTALMKVTEDTASLWATQGSAYRKLFPEDVSAVEVWRRVRTLRLVTATLDQDAAVFIERTKSAAVLGRLIIAYIVMHRLDDDQISDLASDWDSHLANVQRHTHVALWDLATRIDDNHSRRSAPTPSKDFKRVVNCLHDDKWLAREIESILASDGSAGPGRMVPWSPWPSAPEFRMPTGTGYVARGLRCNDGFLVSAGSMAGFHDWPSLSSTQLDLRRNLRDSLGLVPLDGCLRLTRDALFESPSQAAAVMIGHSTNGPDLWTGPDGRSYNLWFPKP